MGDDNIFVGRVKIFGETLNIIMPNDNKNTIIMTGISGIGKTSLIKKLKEEVEETFFNLYYEINYSITKYELLKDIADRLTDKYGFDFQNFYKLYALYDYVINENDTNTLYNFKFDSVNDLKDYFSFLPGFDFFEIGVKVLSKSIKKYNDEKFKKEINRLFDDYRNEKINFYKDLKNTFSQDIVKNTNQKRIIIFLDNFDNVNSTKDVANWIVNMSLQMLTSDIQWVINSRNINQWKSLEDKPNIKIMELLPLTRNYTQELLVKKKISMKNFYNIYNLSQGIPFLIEMITMNYKNLDSISEINSSNIQKTKEYLISTLIDNNDDHMNDILFMISNIKIWDIDTLYKVCNYVLGYIPYSKIERVKKLSFIRKDRYNRYSMDAVIRKLINGQSIEEINKRTQEYLIRLYLNRLRSSELTSNERTLYVRELIFLGQKTSSYDDAIFINQLIKCINSVKEVEVRGNFYLELLEKIKISKRSELINRILYDYSKILFNLSNDYYLRSIHIYSSYLKNIPKRESDDTLMWLRFVKTRLLGEIAYNDKEFLNAKEYFEQAYIILLMTTRINFNILIGLLKRIRSVSLILQKNKNALVISKKIMNLKIKRYGSSDIRVLNYLKELGISYAKVGRDEIKIELFKKYISELSKYDSLGFGLIHSYAEIGYSYSKINKINESIFYYKIALSKYNKKYGNNNKYSTRLIKKIDSMVDTNYR